MRGLVLTVVVVASAQAQWTLQESHTNASLRGIHNIGGGVAWASGTQGAVLHTIDDGQTWQTCGVPPGAEKLDFRGVQAFDRSTAIIMSSGTGDLSRLYKTTDACGTWKLVFTNPDRNGFWDALQFSGRTLGALIGDPVDGHFPIFISINAGDTWQRLDPKALAATDKNQSFFAASNTSLLVDAPRKKLYLVTGGGTSSLLIVDMYPTVLHSMHLDMGRGATAGGFSLASRDAGPNRTFISVGGDYKAPEQTKGTAATWTDDPRQRAEWHASDTPPHGYRSAVAYDAVAKMWIAVGPNGTDVSNDDGHNWRALRPAAGDARDADKNWNALSLPFAVGPNGRIGKLNSHAFVR
jgi:photosystem II stability/assembly factor-like uncharacterized protein